MSSAPHVFISYSREDRDVMRRVRELLSAAGLPVWTDEGIEVGTPNWQLTIESAIEGAECLVCILTPAAKRSAWVREELAYATFQGKPIYMLHAAGDYRQVAILGFTVAQLIDVREEALFAPRIDQLCGRIRGSQRVREGDATTIYSAPAPEPTAAEKHRPRSQAEEIVRHFLPAAVPTSERHVLMSAGDADRPTRLAGRLEQIVVKVGREFGCDVRLEDDSVSREHCQLVYTNEGYVLRDLGSRNGTYVNNERVSVRTIRTGDMIRVGLRCELRYLVARVEGPV